MGWSWREYLETPVDVVDAVDELMQEERDAIEQAKRKR